MVILFYLISLSFGFVTKTISVYHENDQWIIKYKNDPEAVCVATFVETKEAKGFNELSVHSNEKYTNKEQMFCAGFVDGFFSGENIDSHTNNMNTWYLDQYLAKASDYPKSIYKYFDDNIKYIEDNIANNPNDEYWQSVDLIMEQVRGITAGHNFVVEKSKEKTFYDLFMYNSFGDLFDLTVAFPGDEEAKKQPKWYHKYFNDDLKWHINWKIRTKCSGLVKYVEETHDIYVSQAAWFCYGALNRMMKHMDLKLSGDYLSAKKVSFSSYPGMVFSFDDFYMTSNNLAIIETTFTNFNETLNEMINYKSLLDWIRIAISVRAATNGQTFKEIFEKQNSGTYNNQWIVVDYNKLNSVESGLPEGTFTVIEQLPVYVYSKDYSKQLEADGYFGSYNLPAIEETIQMSNLTANCQGNKAFWNSPTESCRAKIYKELAPTVKNMDDMKIMMKYNDYQNDDNCIDPTTGLADAAASIASRYDLRAPELGAMAYGQLDAKICDKSQFDKLRFHVQAGPTHDIQPPLNLTVLEQKGWFVPAENVMKYWEFEWEEFVPN